MQMLGCFWESQSFKYMFGFLKDGNRKRQSDLKRSGYEKQNEKHKDDNLKYLSVIGVWLLTIYVGILFVFLLHSKLSLY